MRHEMELTFITPLFSHGMYPDSPEIRPASIRGQLHWWFRAIGGAREDEFAVFGSVAGGGRASRVVVRTETPVGEIMEIPTLPHKNGGQSAPKNAFAPGTKVILKISTRLDGLGSLRAEFEKALESWLNMGTLGLRSTRAAGSFIWQSNESSISGPEGFEDYENRCRELLAGSDIKFSLLPEIFHSSEDARKVVSDTIGGRNDRAGNDGLARINHPLGKIFGGRKTSPLRFRIAGFDGKFRIAAVWDGRREVTGNTDADLTAAINLLAEARKPIGALLRETPPTRS